MFHIRRIDAFAYRGWRPGTRLVAILIAGATPAVNAPTPAHAQSTSATAVSAPVYNLTAEQWREDLRFMAAEMQRRHKNLYHAITPEKFAAAVADLDARIPTLQRNEIIVGMMRIAAMVGDGHTRVDPRKDAKFGFPSLPLRLYLFDDGLYVRAAAPQFASLVGSRIDAVDGVPVQQAINRVSEIISKDNEMATKLLAPVFLNMPDILQALKLSPTSQAAIFTLRKNGRVSTVTVPAGEIAPRWPDDTDGSFINPAGWVDAHNGPQPLWLQAPLDYHRMIDLTDRKALYTQLNMVTGVKDESLGQFGERIRKHADSTNPRTLIVDLRLNYGGNMDLRSGYVRQLIKAEDDDTRLFVFTARGSFSATEGILVDLRRLTNAVFVGEPASSKPNSYGDGYRSRMPNSGISVQTSIYWHQLAGQSAEPWTGVDIATPLTFADYVSGRDPALELALNYSPRPSLHDRLLAAAKTGGVKAVRDSVAAFQTDVANRYLPLGRLVPQAAELLYEAKQPEEAYAVAEIAARDYPNSVDANIVLAYIAELTRRTDVALRAARRTLELDPSNRTARDIEARLKAPPK
ncbi:MAG TPA: hypothetical protein VJ865_04385 [Gemmatimonadaceae bacterium]|nr:hypothetical protein [Gemmatimonadaceae bacterium]